MFDVTVPYVSSGQELGETRKAMATRLMKDLEDIIDKNKHRDEVYWIMFHAKPWPNDPHVIKIKPLGFTKKPPMMLACLLFEINNKEGKLLLNWALPGNWPTWAVGGKNEPVPEVVGSINELGLHYDIDKILAY